MYNNEKRERLEDIAKRFVNSDIYCNASWMIQELSQDEKYMEDILDFAIQYPDNSEEIEALEDKIDNLENDRDDLSDQIDGLLDIVSDLGPLAEDTAEYKSAADKLPILEKEIKQIEDEIKTLESEKDNLESEQEYPEEALEFWIVSDWMADKLEEQNELITRNFMGFNIWGRKTSGQAIYMDGVMMRIAEKLNNL